MFHELFSKSGWQPSGIGTLLCLSILVAILNFKIVKSKTTIFATLVFLVLSQLSAVAFAGSLVNRTGSFYSSWADLAGLSSLAGDSVDYGSQIPAQNNTKKDLESPSPTSTPWKPSQSGDYSVSKLFGANAVVNRDANGWWQVSTKIRGGLSKIASSVEIDLPPKWSPMNRYPTMFALTGIDGQVRNIREMVHLQDHIAQAVRKGKLHPLLLVVVHDYYVRDSECINSKEGRWEDYLSHDVPNFMKKLGSIQDPSASVLYGFSAGGWCSLMLSVLHSGTFGGAISLSGYTLPRFGSPNPPILSAIERVKYNIPKQLITLRPKVKLWIQTSMKDDSSYSSIKLIPVSKIKSPTSVTLYVMAESGHNFGVWSRLSTIFLPWLVKSLPSFA